MFALVLALVCLVSVDLSAAGSDAPRPPAPELDVYLTNGPSVLNIDARSSAALKQMERELTLLMQPAGFRVVVRGTDRKNGKPVQANSNGLDRQYLVTVELRGSCAAPEASSGEPLRTTLPLASSSVVNGTVLPFTWIDCDALNRFLAPALSQQPSANHTYSYGRAMARLLAHEFYHVLTQSEDHVSAGIAKARLSTNDLLADHFQFDQQALGKFHPVELAQIHKDSPLDASTHDSPVHETLVHDDVAVGGR